MSDRPRRSDRVRWLREHPRMMNATRADVIATMKAAGLLSRKTNRYDVNLYNLMRDAGYGRRHAAKFSIMPHFHNQEPSR